MMNNLRSEAVRNELIARLVGVDTTLTCKKCKTTGHFTDPGNDIEFYFLNGTDLFAPEEDTKAEFIEPLFEVLGWDVRNTENDKEVYKLYGITAEEKKIIEDSLK